MIDKSGKVLLTRRHDRLYLFPRAYVLPGGHLDPGETLKECCIRELHEECGIKIATSALGGNYFMGKEVEVEPYFGFESSSRPRKSGSDLPHSAHFILYWKVQLHVGCEEIELEL